MHSLKKVLQRLSTYKHYSNEKKTLILVILWMISLLENKQAKHYSWFHLINSVNFQKLTIRGLHVVYLIGSEGLDKADELILAK